jgi:hypothetical protein
VVLNNGQGGVPQISPKKQGEKIWKKQNIILAQVIKQRCLHFAMMHLFTVATQKQW